MIINAVVALPPEALNVSQPHNPRMKSRMRPFKMCWPGNVCGFFKMALQFSRTR